MTGCCHYIRFVHLHLFTFRFGFHSSSFWSLILRSQMIKLYGRPVFLKATMHVKNVPGEHI